jgi:hypothetical protein
MQEEFEDTKRVIRNPYIEEEQTTQLPKEKVQKDKQRSTKLLSFPLSVTFTTANLHKYC